MHRTIAQKRRRRSSLKGFLFHIISASRRQGEVDESELNFRLEVIKAAEPRNELETMLLSEMLEIYAAIMWITGVSVRRLAMGMTNFLASGNG